MTAKEKSVPSTVRVTRLVTFIAENVPLAKDIQLHTTSAVKLIATTTATLKTGNGIQSSLLRKMIHKGDEYASFQLDKFVFNGGDAYLVSNFSRPSNLREDISRLTSYILGYL